MAEIVRIRHPLRQSRLFRVSTRKKLAGILGITVQDLQLLLRMEQPYSERQIVIERNGKIKTRDIQEPRGILRPVHERVATLLSRIEPPGFLFCPVKRRSYVSNAMQHLCGREIRTLDIQAYFPSTPKTRVFWFFHKIMECNTDVSIILARLLTVHDRLATGSTASPILSFYAFYDMWQCIAAHADAAGCILTVYMDDVTLSGDIVPDRLMWAVRQEIHKRGLVYHKEKRFQTGIAEITGVLLRDGKAMIPNRQYLKAFRLRADLRAATSSEEAGWINCRLTGLIAQRRQIEVPMKK